MLENNIKELKKKLWDTANDLRANSGLEYSQFSEPILGLIFLKFADNKYSQSEDEIIKEYEELKGSRREKTIDEISQAKCGFYLPKESRYKNLLKLSEENNIAEALEKAIEGIETYSDEFNGVIDKSIYKNLSKEDNNKLLNRLLRNFNDIPVDVDNDIFGEVYEFFLEKFAIAEGQGGGQFFTPRSVVQYMVEVLEPKQGRILDIILQRLIQFNYPKSDFA